LSNKPGGIIMTEATQNTPTGLEQAELKKLVEMAKAISEGDFYKEFNLRIGGELSMLAQYIDKTRKSLQNVYPSLNETSEVIPQASEELKTITEATEKATHSILGSTETILDDCDSISDKLEELQSALDEPEIDRNRTKEIIQNITKVNDANKDYLIQILTNLSFQDLTGQKINKIIDMVREVEIRIFKILVAFNLMKSKDVSFAKMEENVNKLEQVNADEIFEKFQKSVPQDGQVNQDLIDQILNNL